MHLGPILLSKLSHCDRTEQRQAQASSAGLKLCSPQNLSLPASGCLASGWMSMEDCWTSSSDCGAGVCHQDSCKEPYAKAWVALSQVLAEAGRQVIGAAKAGQSEG